MLMHRDAGTESGSEHDRRCQIVHFGTIWPQLFS